MAPVRVQLRRTKGWKMPENTLKVDRSTKWGNPFPWKGSWIVWTAVALGFRADEPGRRAAAVALYRQWMGVGKVQGPLSDDQIGDLIIYKSGLEVDTATMARLKAAEFSTLYADELPPIGDPPDVSELRGHNLGCWCPLPKDGEPDMCHASILLSLANQPGET